MDTKQHLILVLHTMSNLTDILNRACDYEDNADLLDQIYGLIHEVDMMLQDNEFNELDPFVALEKFNELTSELYL